MILNKKLLIQYYKSWDPNHLLNQWKLIQEIKIPTIINPKKIIQIE